MWNCRLHTRSLKIIHTGMCWHKLSDADARHWMPVLHFYVCVPGFGLEGQEPVSQVRKCLVYFLQEDIFLIILFIVYRETIIFYKLIFHVTRMTGNVSYFLVDKKKNGDLYILFFSGTGADVLYYKLNLKTCTNSCDLSSVTLPVLYWDHLG